MGWIIIPVILFLLIRYPDVVVCVIRHIPSVCKYGLKDTYYNIKYKTGDIPKMGKCIAYTGLFGMGKTLSAVHDVRMIYHAYNGTRVFCPRREKWVTLKVNIISNVHLSGIPYVPLTGLQQIVDLSKTIQKYDDEHDTLTISPILIDEAGAMLNSREFKHNIDPLTLNAILTCRHANISIYYTAQRFMHVDALLRQVTSYVYECKKIWRFQFQRKYDAWTLEQAQEPGKIPCMAIRSWFVHDIDYDSYNTYAFVENLVKQVEDGHMISEEEILVNRNISNANLDVVPKKQKRKQRYLF